MRSRIWGADCSSCKQTIATLEGALAVAPNVSSSIVAGALLARNLPEARRSNASVYELAIVDTRLLRRDVANLAVKSIESEWTAREPWIGEWAGIPKNAPTPELDTLFCPSRQGKQARRLLRHMARRLQREVPVQI